ncbi:MAG: helix-turn-helix transcriptional regulator [Xanthobacteraceae bacterium]
MANKLDPVKVAQGKRLAEARAAAGYRSARAAAEGCGWKESSYRSHENGTRKIGEDDAEKYAKKYRTLGVNITAQKILFGDKPSHSPTTKSGRISLDAIVAEESDEEVRRIAEALQVLRRQHAPR